MELFGIGGVGSSIKRSRSKFRIIWNLPIEILRQLIAIYFLFPKNIFKKLWKKLKAVFWTKPRGDTYVICVVCFWAAWPRVENRQSPVVRTYETSSSSLTAPEASAGGPEHGCPVGKVGFVDFSASRNARNLHFCHDYSVLLMLFFLVFVPFYPFYPAPVTCSVPRRSRCHEFFARVFILPLCRKCCSVVPGFYFVE